MSKTRPKNGLDLSAKTSGTNHPHIRALQYSLQKKIMSSKDFNFFDDIFDFIARRLKR